MTPKEKAQELFNNSCDYADYTDEDCCLTERETMYKNAKMIALIVANETINEIKVYFLERYDAVDRFFFWKDVKQEIEKINIFNV